MTKQDQNVLIMLLVQICILFILSIPLAVQKLYSAIADGRTPSALQAAIENLVYSLAQLLHFVANGIPFYIYTLAGGKVF
ncbi:unnamed protein product, partial [Rotaria sp. Silwood1]